MITKVKTTNTLPMVVFPEILQADSLLAVHHSTPDHYTGQRDGTVSLLHQTLQQTTSQCSSEVAERQKGKFYCHYMRLGVHTVFTGTGDRVLALREQHPFHQE